MTVILLRASRAEALVPLVDHGLSPDQADELARVWLTFRRGRAFRTRFCAPAGFDKSAPRLIYGA